MELLKHLKNGCLLIVPKEQKLKILEEIDTLDHLLNVHILSMEEFKRKYYFDYSRETLIYLTHKYDIKISVAKVYLENMYYLNGLYTSSDRLNELTFMKSNLLEHNLLKRDPFFLESLKNRSIVFYGYDYYLKEEEQFIEELKQIVDVQVFRPAENPSKTLQVHCFSALEEEVEYVFNQICSLINKGISCNQIKLAGVSSEYEEPLIRLAKFYHLPISLSTKVSLYQTLFGKKTIEYLQDGYDFYDVLTFLEKDFQDLELLQMLKDIFNRYAFFEEEKTNILEFLIDDMKHSYLPVLPRKEEIEVIPLIHNELDSSMHVFVLGFNNGNFPRIFKDEEFIRDDLREELGLTTTEEINKLEREALMNRLFGISNLTITYKLKTYFDEYYPSTLIQDYQMEEIREEETSVHYSKEYDTLKLTAMLDKYIQLGEKDPSLEKYYASLKIPYLTYNHTYQAISTSTLHEHFHQKLLLSYSALDRFYHCKFRYYLQDVLKLVKYENTLSIMIGNIFHAVLSRAFVESFDFDKEYQEECSKYELTDKDKFYLDKLKPELLFIIETIQNQNLVTGFHDAFYEEKIYIPQKTSFPVTFMGIVDKILFRKKDGKELISIIDYKTGSPDLDLRLVPYGLNLQLPVYMYLTTQSSKFKNSQICGIYLQKILNSVSNSKDVLEEKKNALKLRGYSISDEYLLEVWDPTYENSEVIQGLKKGKNGWYRYAKLLSSDEIIQLIELTETKIQEATMDILNGDFTINPKRIDGKNIGCEFCAFQDICYHKEQDIVDLEPYIDLSFLQKEE